MLKAGKIQEIAHKIVDCQLQVIAIQEIRWRGYGLLKRDKYSLYYSSNPNSIGQAGTGFMIQKLAMNKILGFQSISDHICKLRVKGKSYNITLINIYAPTEDKETKLKSNSTRNYRELRTKYQNTT
jgi:exonuclease III